MMILCPSVKDTTSVPVDEMAKKRGEANRPEDRGGALSPHSMLRRGAQAVTHRRTVAVKPMNRLPEEQSARTPARA